MDGSCDRGHCRHFRSHPGGNLPISAQLSDLAPERVIAMQGTEQPQIDMKLLEQLLAQEMKAAETAALAQAQQGQAALSTGQITPQMIAAIQHEMSLPLATRPRQQTPQRDNRPLWIAAIAGISTSVTVLGLAAIVSGSLAGNRGTAELNTAVIALSETAKSVSETANRPNVTCISFNCGGLQRQVEPQPSAPAVVDAPLPAGQLYAQGYQEGSTNAAGIYQNWSPEQIAAEITRLQQAKAHGGATMTPDRIGRIDAYLAYLGG